MSIEYQPPMANVDRPDTKRRLAWGIFAGILFAQLVGWVATAFLYSLYFLYNITIGQGILDVTEFFENNEFGLLVVEYIAVCITSMIATYLFARIVNRCTYRDVALFILMVIVVTELISMIFQSTTTQYDVYQHILNLPFMLLGGFLWLRQIKSSSVA